ncbi:MAG TPA: hypothetical protein VIK28_10455 [Sedimentisphaerales bacterium]
MKIFIAYTLVVIGIPYLAGLLFGQVLTFPLAVIVGLFRRPTDEATQAQAFIQATEWSLRGSSTKMPVADRILHVCMDVFNGFGAVLTAGFLFHLFGLPLGVAVLLILAAWEIFFTIAYGQAFRTLFSTLAGIVIGWFVVLRLFSF